MNHEAMKFLKMFQQILDSWLRKLSMLPGEGDILSLGDRRRGRVATAAGGAGAADRRRRRVDDRAGPRIRPGLM